MDIKGVGKSGKSGKEHEVLIDITSKAEGVLLAIHSPGNKQGWPKYIGLKPAEAKKLIDSLTKAVP